MPSVSIIVPCYNENTRIHFLLDAIYVQTYPRAGLEVVIADGCSTDGTRETIADFAGRHPDLTMRIIDNDARSIPAALNRAIDSARGDIILRLDAHSGPYPEYVARCVEALEAGKGEVVGGVWEIHPGDQSWVAKSIAAAAAHPLGVGDALYRHSKQAAYVDTVPFGCFRRALVGRVGGFDESLLSNEDYEFNARVRKSGGRIWLDPAIRSVYFARDGLAALAQQYWRYGFWKWRMLHRYPRTLRWRQALPPLFVLSLLVDLLLCWIPIAAAVLLLEILVYLTALLAAGMQRAIVNGKAFMIIGLPLAMATMHLAWGSGFLASVIGPSGRANGR